MKALITGSEGFVGRHLCAEMQQNGYQVIRCDLLQSEQVTALDILAPDSIARVLADTQPELLINMAGQADVGLSWKLPQKTVELNTIGLINILEAVRASSPGTRVIAIGSSDEYGFLRDRGVNVTEDLPVQPITPYAISKQAQELFARLYHRSYGLDICMIRQFNLGGGGQARGYMISDFSAGIAEIEAGKREYLSVGNLESARDFTHVKDACRAIRLIAEKGHAGEVYNVCSGVTHTAREVLDRLIAMARAPIEVRHDPARMRASDTPVVRGNHDKLTAHTGWQPTLTLEDILLDALEYWRKQI